MAALSRTKVKGQHFAKKLGVAMTELARVCKEHGRIIFTYQNLDGTGWSALATAMATSGVFPLVAFPMYGDGAAGLHKHDNSISWDCVLVCEPRAPVLALRLSDGIARGALFKETWSRKLIKSGHNLSPGDLANLQHAGTMVSAFALAAARGERERTLGGRRHA